MLTAQRTAAADLIQNIGRFTEASSDVNDERKRCIAGVGLREIRTSRYMNKSVRN